MKHNDKSGYRLALVQCIRICIAYRYDLALHLGF